MSQAVYLVAPEDRLFVIDGIAQHLTDAGIVDRLGCVVEKDADRRTLSAESSVPYESIDVAPDLSPESITDAETTSGDRSLTHFQSEYGDPFLTRIVVADARYDDVSRRAWNTLIERAFGFFEQTLTEFAPTVVVTPRIARPFEWVPARIAAQDGTYLWWKTTRIGSQYGLIEGSPFEEFCGIQTRFRELRSTESELNSSAARKATEYLSDIRTGGVRPDFYARRADSYGQSLRKLVFPHGIPLPRELTGLLQQRLLGAPTDFDDHRLPKAKNVLRRLRLRLEDPFELPQQQENFVFFPLHAQPEVSTRILSPLFEDQITLAEQLARSLPVDYCLYVKDHPRMLRDRTRTPAYYRQLSAIPGVRLLPANADSHTLVQDASAVASITGTPALEAAFFSTPSVVFGPTHFTALSTVRRCRAIDELSDILAWSLSDPDWSREEVINYLTAVFENSFSIPSTASGTARDAQRQVAEHVAPHLLDRLEQL